MCSSDLGVVAGANLVLVDFHPNPAEALVDGPQALLMRELEPFIEDMSRTHAFYRERVAIWTDQLIDA